MKAVGVNKRGVFLEGKGCGYDGSGARRGGCRGAAGPPRGEATVGWTRGPREVLLAGGRRDRRLFVVLRRNNSFNISDDGAAPSPTKLAHSDT